MNSVNQKLTVLGATGSIGESTLDVVARHPERYSIYALVAHQNIAVMFKRAVRYRPEIVVMTDVEAAQKLREQFKIHAVAIRVEESMDAACTVAAEADVVMAAIVGAAGLKPTLAAVKAGRRVLLANKESLVMGGAFFVNNCREFGATVLPIDSEHNAIFQCLPTQIKGNHGPALAPCSLEGVSKLVLTASGGPFRNLSHEQMRTVTVQQAVAHPNWSMGPKISVDSASLMNKGLELIEACWLFGLDASQVDVIVHPQSIIHSMVQYIDGSLLAQMGRPDMRTPIADCLAWPGRISSGVAPLDLLEVARLDFAAPDTLRFPCLQLARDAWSMGSRGPCVLNAANEIAVEAFLNRRIAFLDIANVNKEMIQALGEGPTPNSIEEVIELDQLARLKALELVQTLS